MFLSSWLKSFKQATGLVNRRITRTAKSRRDSTRQSAEWLEDRALLVSAFSFPTLAGSVVSPVQISHSSTIDNEPNFSVVATDVPTFLDPTEITLITGAFVINPIVIVSNPITATVMPTPADITQFNDGYNVVRTLTNAAFPRLDVYQEQGNPLVYVRFGAGPASFGSTTIRISDGINDLDIPVWLNDVPALDRIDNISVPEDTPLVSVPLSGITAGGSADDPSNNGQERLVYVDPNTGTTNPFLTGIPIVKYNDAAMDKIGTLEIRPVKGAPIAVTKNGDNVATITVTIEDGGIDNVVGKSYDEETGDLTITNFPATLDNISRSVTFTLTVLPQNDAPTIDDVKTATTTLAGSNQVTDSTLTVVDGSRFPPSANPNFEIEIDNERMQVTNVVLNPDGTSTFTVIRALNGTIIAQHSAGATVTLIDALVLYEDDLAGATTVTLTGVTAGGGSSPIGNEKQLVSIAPTATPAGTFTLTFDNGTHAYTTDLIPFDAPATVSRDETISLSTNATGGDFTLTLANNIGAVTSLDSGIPNATDLEFDVDDTIGFPVNSNPLVPFVISVGNSVLGTLTTPIDNSTTTVTLTNPIVLPSAPFVIQVDQETMNVTAVAGSVLTVTRGYNGTTAVAHNGSLGSPISVIGTMAEEMLVIGVTIAPVTGNPNHAKLKVVRGYHGTTPAAHPDYASVVEQRTTALNQPAGLVVLPNSPLAVDIANTVDPVPQNNTIRVVNGGVFPAVATDLLLSDVTIVDTVMPLVDVTAFSTLSTPFKILVDSEVMVVTSVDVPNNTMTVLRAQDGTTLAAHAANSPVYNHFTIRVDREEMFVTAVNGSDLTVVRGANGTSIVAHGNGFNATFPTVSQIDDVIRVVDAQVLPSATPFEIRIDNEDMLVTAVVGDQLLVNRGLHRTAIGVHLDQSRVSHMLTTGTIQYNADAFAIKNALAALPVVGPSGVQVIGGPLGTGPVQIKFINTLGKLDLDNLTSDVGGLTGNQVQRIQITGNNFTGNGTFRLVFSGQTTAPIAHNADADTIRLALEALPNINPGDLIVTGGPFPLNAVTIEFTGQYANQVIPAIGFPAPPYSVANPSNGTSLTNDERQQIEITGANGGSFRLTFTDGFNFFPPRTFTTGPITYDPADGDQTAQNIQNALQNLDPPFLSGVQVQPDLTFPLTRFIVTFSGNCGDLNVNSLIVLAGDNNLTPAGNTSIRITTLEDGNQQVSDTPFVQRAVTNLSASPFQLVSGALSIHDALVRLQSVTNADVKTSGLELPTSPTEVEFTGSYAGLDVAQMSVNNAPVPLVGLVDNGGTASVSNDVNGDGVVDIRDRHFDGELQKLAIIAVSNRAEIVPNPVVNYVSPNGSGTLTFTNFPDRFGEADVTITVSDSGFDQDLAKQDDNGNTTKKIHVTVKPTNDQPTINALPDISIPKNSSPLTINLKGISAGGNESQDLRVTASSSNTALLEAPSIVYNNGAGTAVMTLTPIAGKTNSNTGGPSLITVTVEDAGVDGVLNTPADNGRRQIVFRLDVTEAPTLAPTPSAISIAEDAGLQSLNLSGITAGSGESQPLLVTVSNNNTTLFTSANLNVAYTSPNNTAALDYQSTAQLSGSDVFHLTVTDAGPDGKLGTSTALSADVTASALLVSVANSAVFQTIPTDKLALPVSLADSTVTVSDATPFGTLTFPFKMQIGDEVLSVTGKPTNTLFADVTIGAATITLSDASAFPNASPTSGYKIRIDSEEMLVIGKLGNVLQVLRAQSGTVAAAHTAPASVVAFNTFTVIRGEDGTNAATHAVNDNAVQPFKIRIGSETLRVTGITANNLTVTRGVDGTTAAAHLVKDDVVHPDSFDNLSILRDIPVTVTPVNDLPTLDDIKPNPQAPGFLTIPEGSGEQIISLSGISDGEGAGARQHLRIDAVSSNPALTGPITYVYNDGDSAGSIKFTPTPGVSGSAGITVTVFDGGSDNNLNTLESDLSDKFSKVLNVTVVPIGDVPTINAVANLTIGEDGSSSLAANISLSQATISVANGSVFPIAVAATPSTHFTVQVDSELLRVTNVSGNTLTVTRGFGSTVPATHSTGALVLPAFSLTGISDGDANTQQLRVTVSTTDTNLISNLALNYNPTNLQPPSVPPSTGTLSFMPGADRFGTASITVIVTDGGADTRLGIDTLTGGILMADVPAVFTVANPTRFPSAPGFNVRIDNEELTVTGISGNQFTATRAQNGTSAATHAVGAVVSAPDTVADNVSSSRTFTVTVNPVNDNPTITTINGTNVVTLSSVTLPAIDEDAPLQTINLAGISPGPSETQTVSVSVSSSNTALIQPTANYVNGSPTGTITFKPLANKFGTAILTVKIQDAGKDGNINTLTDNGVTLRNIVVKVNALNDDPELNAVAPVTVAEESGVKTVNLTGITAGGGEPQILKVTPSVQATSIAGLITNLSIDYSSPNDTGVLKFTPGVGLFGTATIQVTVEDAGFDGIMGTSGFLASAIGAADSTLTLTTGSVFPATATPNFTIRIGTERMRVTNVAGNVLTVTRGVDSTTAAAHTLGETVRTSPQSLDNETFSRNIAVTVNNVEDAPVFTVPTNATVNKSNYLDLPVNLTGVYDGDLNSQTLTLSFVSSDPSFVPAPADVVLPAQGVPSTTSQPVTLHFNPAPNQTGDVTITVTANDGVSAPVSQDFVLHVVDANLPPTIDQPAAFVLAEDDVAKKTIQLTGISAGGNETQGLKITAVSSDPNAIVIDNNNDIFYVSPNSAGSLDFYPQLNAANVPGESFKIMITVTDDGGDGNFADSNNNSTTTTVNVQIDQGNNDDPTLAFIQDQVFGKNELPTLKKVDLSGISAGPYESANVDVTAAVLSDPNGIINGLTVTAPTLPGSTSTDSLTFTPTANVSGTAQIQVTVDDHVATPFSRTFLVHVVNRPTIDSVSNPASVLEDTLSPPTINITGLSDGDLGTEGGTLTVTSSNQELISNANLLLSNTSLPSGTATPGTSTLSYTLNPDANGTTIITLTAIDKGPDGVVGGGDDASFPTSFTITVTPGNDKPTLTVPATLTLTEDDLSNPANRTINLTNIFAKMGDLLDESGQPLKITAVSADPSKVVVSSINYTSNQSTGSVIVAPVQDAFTDLLNPILVTITVEDGGTDNNLATSVGNEKTERVVEVYITPVNDEPTLTAISDVVIDEDSFAFLSADISSTSQTTFDVLDKQGFPTTGPYLIQVDNEQMQVLSISGTTFTVNRGVGGTTATTHTANALVSPSIGLSGITAGPGESQGLNVTLFSDNEDLIPNDNEHRFFTFTSATTGVLRFAPLANKSGDAFITVTVTDDDLLDPKSFSQTFKVQVNKVNDAPVINGLSETADSTVSLDGLTATINENLAVGTEVAVVDFDDEGPLTVLDLSIIAGNTDGAFSIDPAGTIKVAKASAIDFEKNPTFTLTVRIVDNSPVAPAAAPVTKDFTIKLLDLSEVLTIGTGNWPVSGGITLKRSVDGDLVERIHVLDSSTMTDLASVPAHAIANVSKIEVNGRPGMADVLTLDYSGDDPVGVPDGLTFNGGTGAGDTIVFANAAFTQLNTTFSSATAANIVDPGNVFGPISLLGIEGITFGSTVTVTNLNFVYGSGADVVTIADDSLANGVSSFSASSSPTVTFPADARLTIDLGNGDNSLTINSIENAAGPAVTVLGGTGSDVMYALADGRKVSFSGGAGSDVLFGGSGADTLLGGDNDDFLSGGEGDDSLNGGSGTNTLTETSDTNYSVGNGLTSGGIGIDNFENIQFAQLRGGSNANAISAAGFTGSATIIGEAGDDILTGSSQADFFIGDIGDDEIHGGDGIDTLYEFANVNFTLGVSTLTGLGSDTFDGIEQAQLAGGDGNNTLDASSFLGSVTLNGGAGSDLLKGGIGNDALFGDAGADTLMGNGGTNSLDGGTEVDQVFASGDNNFTLTPTQLSSSLGTDNLVLDSIETAKLVGGIGNNTLNASTFTGKTTLQGGDGDDTLIGGTSADSLEGGGNNDQLTGGLGNDSFVGGAGSDTIFEANVKTLSLTATSMTGRGADVLAGMELASLSGTTGNDTISGGTFAGVMTIAGFAGADSLTGGKGNDSILGGDSSDILRGGGGSDVIRGGAGADQIFGGLGDDTDDSKLGNDSIDGGSGNDTIYGEGGNDVVLGGDGSDTIRGGLDNDAIDGQVGNDRIFGEGGNDTLIGGTGADYLHGGVGNDKLWAGDYLANSVNPADGAKDTLISGPSISGITPTEVVKGNAASADFDVMTDPSNTAAEKAAVFAFDYHSIFDALL